MGRTHDDALSRWDRSVIGALSIANGPLKLYDLKMTALSVLFGKRLAALLLPYEDKTNPNPSKN